ncbi:hypothetical protein KUTeg_004039 [Tegillarca granosa]|uniref:Uncharacterized protein n=1 Tax=Tegillarca granosa TaxID=220873 RepID=A0ABQ9FNU5_TEGGR|nr:hypothetical protein KUTeg_004039 [Tegillarca granosa]
MSEVIDIRYEQLSLVNVSCKNWLLNSTNVKNRTNTVIQNKEQLINLKDVIKQKCYDKKPVPNVIHYVWLGLKKKEMKFYQFLSVYSCHKYLHPCLILFHGETLPYGRYWDLLQTVVPNIIHVKISSPTNIEGIQLKHIEHKADIVRLWWYIYGY